MIITKVFTYKHQYDMDGRMLRAKFLEVHDENLETDDYEKELPVLAEKYKCDFVEVAVINIKPKQ